MQYTVRQVPKAVDKALRAKAKAEGKSLNEVAVEAEWARRHSGVVSHACASYD